MKGTLLALSLAVTDEDAPAAWQTKSDDEDDSQKKPKMNDRLHSRTRDRMREQK